MHIRCEKDITCQLIKLIQSELFLFEKPYTQEVVFFFLLFLHLVYIAESKDALG